MTVMRMVSRGMNCFLSLNIVHMRNYTVGVNTKKKLGWHVLRVVAENDKGECIALAQSLYKTYPLGLAVMWVPGGPTGDMSSINKALFDTLHKNSRCKFLYCRISPFVDNGKFAE